MRFSQAAKSLLECSENFLLFEKINWFLATGAGLLHHADEDTHNCYIILYYVYRCGVIVSKCFIIYYMIFILMTPIFASLS